MSAPALPLMRDYRRFVNLDGLGQVNHNMNGKYGDGAAARSLDLPPGGGVRGKYGDESNKGNYFRRNLLLNDDGRKRDLRQAPGELRVLIYRKNTED